MLLRRWDLAGRRHARVALRSVNADEIGSSILELGSMQSWARGLKKRLLPANRGMQSAGVTYHKKLLELQELTHIQEALAAAHQVRIQLELRFF